MAENTTAQVTTAQATPEQVEEQIREALQKDIDSSGNRSDDAAFADRLIGNALSLRQTQRDLTKKTGSNRDMLRGMVDQDLLTDTQKSAVALLYPVRERKAKTPEQNGAAAKPAAAKPAAKPAAA